MKLLFLDIDGVLNAHDKFSNGYCGIDGPQVAQLNRILEAVPDVKLVISSAWRYLVITGEITLKGFEYLLLIQGINAENRIAGITEADPAFSSVDPEAWKIAGLEWRRDQIINFLLKTGDVKKYVVLDDLPVEIPNLIKTRGNFGLAANDADRAIEILLADPK